MKLKIYRFSLIFMLLISIGLSIFLGIKSTLNVLGYDKVKLSDGIMYILCFLLLLSITVLEIANTIISFKNGSVYIKGLTYNDNNTINRNSLYVAGGIAIFSLFTVIYISFTLNRNDLPLSTLDTEAKYFMISAFALAFINAMYVVLFPLLAREDQSLQENK